MEGDYLDFPSKSFCLTKPKHFVEEPFSAVYQKISGREKVYGKEGGGWSIEILRWKFFFLKVPKSFVGELLVCLFFRGSKIVMLQRVMSRFSVEVFCLTVPKHFVEETFSAVYQRIAGNGKVYGKEMGRGSIESFRRNFFVSIAETIRRGTLYSFISFGYRKCSCFRGLCHNFPWHFFVSEYRTIS